MKDDLGNHWHGMSTGVLHIRGYIRVKEGDRLWFVYKMLHVRRGLKCIFQRQFTTNPLILGIETSCDDTGASVMRGNAVLSDIVNSQQNIHLR